METIEPKMKTKLGSEQLGLRYPKGMIKINRTKARSACNYKYFVRKRRKNHNSMINIGRF